MLSKMRSVSTFVTVVLLLQCFLLLPVHASPPAGEKSSLEAFDLKPFTNDPSVTSSVYDPAMAAVPSPWSDQDIGSPTKAGSANYNASTGQFTVSGAGTDIWGTSDQFHYVYRTLQGDGKIIAQVEGITDTHDFAKSGVMIRESLAANAKHVDIAKVPSGQYTFQYRANAGETTASVKVPSTDPSWLKLERSGNLFTGSYSTDGATWTQVGQQTVSMGSNVYIGLAVSSHNTGKLNTSTFAGVTVTGADTVPPTAPTGLTAGNVTETTIALTWTASTDNVGVTDYDVYRNGVLTGNHIPTIGYTVVGLSPGTNYSFTVQARDAAGNLSTASSPLAVSTLQDMTPPTAPSGLSASNITASSATISWLPSTDNVDVTGYDIYKDGVLTGSSNDTSYGMAGLTANTTYSITVKAKDAAGNVSAASTAFALTTTSAGPGPLPTPWASQDIGSPSVTGNAAYNSASKVYTISGAGTDIWGTADQFSYAYQPWTGDGTIVAVVTSQTNPDPWAKAGIMIRESLNANAKHADLLLTPSNGFTFQYRTTAGGTTQSVKQASSSPAWLKLQRTGNVIKGYVSNNGLNWGDIGNVTVSMNSTVYVGLAVTSHNTSQLSTATFEYVTVNANGDIFPPTAPSNVAVNLLTDVSVGLTWSASLDDIGVTGYDVYKDGAFLASTGTTNYTATGLTPNTKYTFTIKAKDAAGHVSDASSPLIITTAAVPDTQKPTAPTGLASPSKTSSSINLTWNASTDNVGVYQYDIYAGGSLAASTSGTSVTLTGLTPNTTYSLTVKARDLAGNVSNASSSISVKTNTTSGDPYTPQVIANNLQVPWAMAFAPDGRLFFTERNSGRIRVVINGQLRSTPVITLGAPFYYQDRSEGGLLGIALDPNFSQNHYIYVYHTYKAAGNVVKNRVVRLIENNNTAILDTVLISDLPGAVYHNGGRLKVGPDNKLYFSDGNYGRKDDTLTYLGGKIMRLNLDGTIPTDNPFGSSSPVYSKGHRNPQGLAWQPGTNRLFESEHGEQGNDEINFIQPGKDYGWPDYEGDNQNKPGITPPLIHSGITTWAPSGITFVTKGPWAGNLLVANLKGKQIIRMVIGEQNGKPTIDSQNYLFKNQYGRIREVLEAPDGSIYFITSNNGDKNGDGTPDKLVRLVPNF